MKFGKLPFFSNSSNSLMNSPTRYISETSHDCRGCSQEHIMKSCMRIPGLNSISFNGDMLVKEECHTMCFCYNVNVAGYIFKL